jgi:hypothetical protein
MNESRIDGNVTARSSYDAGSQRLIVSCSPKIEGGVVSSSAARLECWLHRVFADRWDDGFRLYGVEASWDEWHGE